MSAVAEALEALRVCGVNNDAEITLEGKAGTFSMPVRILRHALDVAQEAEALGDDDRALYFAAGAAATIALNYRALGGSVELPALDEWKHLAGGGS